jgi:hypothetical protein
LRRGVGYGFNAHNSSAALIGLPRISDFSRKTPRRRLAFPAAVETRLE